MLEPYNALGADSTSRVQGMGKSSSVWANEVKLLKTVGFDIRFLYRIVFASAVHI